MSNWSGGNADGIGVFRNGAWIVDSNANLAWEPADSIYSFGLPGDLAVTGKWTAGAQRKQLAVFRGGQWALDNNGTNAYEPTDSFVFFGLPGDLPVVGFWSLP